jgi:hypothetical protein
MFHSSVCPPFVRSTSSCTLATFLLVRAVTCSWRAAVSRSSFHNGRLWSAGLEDVVFSVHAAFITALTLLQCFLFDRGGQRFGSAIGKATCCTLVATIIGAGIVAVSEATDKLGDHGVTWIRFLLALSLVKLIVTLIKYIPQARANHFSIAPCSLLHIYASKSLQGFLQLCSCLGRVGLCWFMQDATEYRGAGHAQPGSALHCWVEYNERVARLHRRHSLTVTAPHAMLGIE